MNADSLKQSCIFVIDDEPANLKLLNKMLASQGYSSTILIQDPREVIDRYRQTRPDLILLDINMPHLDGFEVLDRLKALNDPLMPPVVILTAQHGREHLLKAFAAGARDFVSKPFDRAELLMRVRNLLEAHFAHRMIHDQKNVLEDMVRLRTEELKETQLQVLRRLGRAAEFRDNETGNHILRMSKICSLLAKSLGWPNEEVELMLHASPMHDIGKIGITDSILLKPGKLEPEEFQIMKTHAEIGAGILEGGDSALLRLARTIALTHHEKWDGSGYPLGLSGTDIPIASRIAAVADVFDALISSRPYKPAWPLEKAIDFLKENTGRHFDPEIVEHFLKNLDAVKSIVNQYPEVYET